MALRYLPNPHKFPQDNDVQYFLLFWELPTRLGWRFVKDQVRRTELAVGKTCDRVLPNSIPHVECLMRTAEDAKLGFGSFSQLITKRLLRKSRRLVNADSWPQDHFVEKGMTTIENHSFIVAWARRWKGKLLEISERERYTPPYLRIQRLDSFHRSDNSLSSENSSRSMSKTVADMSTSRLNTNGFVQVDDKMDSQSPPIIPYSRAVIISGLPDNMTSAAARHFLSKWGDVVTCVVHPPSVCKAQFEYAGDVINVAKHLHETVMSGRRVRVRSQAIPPSPDLDVLGSRHAERPSAAAATTVESGAMAAVGGVVAEESDASLCDGKATGQGVEPLDGPGLALDDSTLPSRSWPPQRSQPLKFRFPVLCSTTNDQKSSTLISISPPSPTNSSESSTPFTDSEGRSIVGGGGRKSIKRITFVKRYRCGNSYRQNSSDTDSDDDHHK